MPPSSQPRVNTFTLKHKLSHAKVVPDSKPESIEDDMDIDGPAFKMPVVATTSKGHCTTQSSVSQTQSPM